MDSLTGPISTLDSGKTKLITILVGEAKMTTTAPAVQFNDAPDVKKAASMTIKSPPLGSCTSKPELSVGSTGGPNHNVLLNFEGTDVLPASACADFAQAVKMKGVVVEFANAPYYNGGTATKVEITLTR